MSNTLFDALFAPHLENDAPFLEADSGETLSYHAFLQRAAQLAHVLVENGVKPGDRVVVQAPKLVDTVALYAASAQAGAVYLPLNTAYTLAELEYFIGDARPAMIVCDDRDADAIAELAGA